MIDHTIIIKGLLLLWKSWKIVEIYKILREKKKMRSKIMKMYRESWEAIGVLIGNHGFYRKSHILFGNHQIPSKIEKIH